MQKWQYTKGLHNVGNGCYAWLQPDGGWGLSNAGLIVDGDQNLLVDTLIDIPLTQEMLGEMARAVPAARTICRCVNTHSHPDHTSGNCLLHGTEIIASTAAAQEMQWMAKGDDPFSRIIKNWQDHGDAGAYLHDVMGSRFQTHLSTPNLPTRTFDTELELKVGDKLVRLFKIGPAHTAGDVVVYVPKDGILFTGDVLFHQVHPAISPGCFEAWIAACDTLLQWNIEVIVPGHGPIAEKSALVELKNYLIYFKTETRKRFDAGMSVEQAARDISLAAFAGWADEERIFMTVANLYKDFGAEAAPFMQLLGMAGRYRREMQTRAIPISIEKGLA